jgi:hypothetical protein
MNRRIAAAKMLAVAVKLPTSIGKAALHNFTVLVT